MTRSRSFDPWILLLLALTAGPVLCGLIFMLLYASGGIGLFSTGWTVAHWRAALFNPEVWLSLGYSAAIGLLSLVLASSIALAVQGILKRSLARGVLRMLLFVPLAFPPLVAALVSVQLFSNAGLLARFAHRLGLIQSPSEFPDLLFTASGTGILLTHVLLVTPALILLFDRLAQHARVAEFVRVACTLGASPLQAWRRVTLPVLLRAAAPALAVYGIVLIGAFEIPLMLGAPYPEMITVMIQRRYAAFNILGKADAYAIASIYALISMGLLFVTFTWNRPLEERR